MTAELHGHALHVLARHGGRLSIDSTPGRGATFVMHLPLPTEDDRGRCFQGVADIATNVPVWTLTSDGNLQNLSDLAERITSTSLEYA